MLQRQLKLDTIGTLFLIAFYYLDHDILFRFSVLKQLADQAKVLAVYQEEKELREKLHTLPDAPQGLVTATVVRKGQSTKKSREKEFA